MARSFRAGGRLAEVVKLLNMACLRNQRNQRLLAVPNARTHPSLLPSQFPPSATRLLNTHVNSSHPS